MTDAFTITLQQHTQPTWDRAVGHRFVRELYDGSIDDAVMAGYLVQDHRFLDSFLVLLGSAICTADDFEARLTLSRFVGEVAGDENTYFLRSFEALGVTPEQRQQIPDTAATAGFKQIFREAAETRSYAAALAVLLVTEWLYLDWGSRAPRPLPENFVHAEWITLHDYPGFHDFVAFLRAELDRVGPGEQAVAEDFFARTVDLELAFFDQSYQHPLEG